MTNVHVCLVDKFSRMHMPCEHIFADAQSVWAIIHTLRTPFRGWAGWSGTSLSQNAIRIIFRGCAGSSRPLLLTYALRTHFRGCADSSRSSLSTYALRTDFRACAGSSRPSMSEYAFWTFFFFADEQTSLGLRYPHILADTFLRCQCQEIRKRL